MDMTTKERIIALLLVIATVMCMYFDLSNLEVVR